ncbi:MAG: hypothetical protein K8S18_03030 [Desulfobacula sp.]|nr:hypothetical protein [Desulfobacula sp.]
MANRPVFIPKEEPANFVKEISFDFKWNSGFAAVQKKKNIVALHNAAGKDGYSPLLEISTKSEDAIGQRLSAFNLKIETKMGMVSIESAYQGGKVFENGGPFTDIYHKSSREAKKDERIRKSGKIIGFDFLGERWPIVPKTAFYDWLYLKALQPHQKYLKEKLYEYKGFTDIEFNPKKSINCQARTCALLVSFLKLDILDFALKSKDIFIGTVFKDSISQKHSVDVRQIDLFQK